MSRFVALLRCGGSFNRCSYRVISSSNNKYTPSIYRTIASTATCKRTRTMRESVLPVGGLALRFGVCTPQLCMPLTVPGARRPLTRNARTSKQQQQQRKIDWHNLVWLYFFTPCGRQQRLRQRKHKTHTRNTHAIAHCSPSAFVRPSVFMCCLCVDCTKAN